MKKLSVLLGIILCCLSGFAQNLSVSPSTIVTGESVTITATGETSDVHFTYATEDYTNIAYSDGIPRSWVSIYPITDFRNYSAIGNQPTSFKMKLTNSDPVASYTVTIGVKMGVTSPGGPQQNVTKYFTVTVKPVAVPTTFSNTARSKTFYKNDCPSGFASDPYPYSVPAGKYTSTISQQDADTKAQAEIDANGQNMANASQTCKQVYYSAEVSGSFTKNSCGSGYVGSVVIYVIPVGKYTSLISQADADQKAVADLNTNGQNNANSMGRCTEVRKRYRALLRPSGVCSPSDEVASFIWIKENVDLNKIYSQGKSGVFVYTGATGNTPALEGNYRIMYLIQNTGEQGNRIFSIDNSGEIIGYTLCAQ